MILKSRKNVEILVDDDCPEWLSKITWTIIDKGSNFYVRGWIPNMANDLYLHRLIMNAKSGEFVDHINGNTLDNRKCNLRICTQKENNRNKAISKNNKTGYKCVTAPDRLKNCKNPYVAEIRVNSKKIHLGYFSTAELAAKAYNDAAIKYFGEFARLNEIED